MSSIHPPTVLLGNHKEVLCTTTVKGNNITFLLFIVIFLGQFCPKGNGSMSLTLCEAPACEKRPDHNTGN